MATTYDWEAELEAGQFTCVTCGRASDPHELDGMEECEACIPEAEKAQARSLLNDVAKAEGDSLA